MCYEMFHKCIAHVVICLYVTVFSKVYVFYALYLFIVFHRQTQIDK
jgi:hypothetical protein